MAFQEPHLLPRGCQILRSDLSQWHHLQNVKFVWEKGVEEGAEQPGEVGGPGDLGSLRFEVGSRAQGS